MKILAVKSVPLAEDTVAAWRAAAEFNEDGVKFRFMKRDRTPNEAVGLATRNNYNMVLNLGNSELVSNHNMIWNNHEVCSMLRTPGALRRSPLAAALPPIAKYDKPYWVKGPGRAGINKWYCETEEDEKRIPYPAGPLTGWDVQEHVDGIEWRVLTVGHRVVQSSRRFGPNGARTYEWVGTADTPKFVKNLCRYAASMLPNARSVIAWDVIVNDLSGFIFEGNTCPGVNEQTAQRILSELFRQVELGDVRDEPLPAVHRLQQELNRWQRDFRQEYTIEIGGIVYEIEDDPAHGRRATVRIHTDDIPF